MTLRRPVGATQQQARNAQDQLDDDQENDGRAEAAVDMEVGLMGSTDDEEEEEPAPPRVISVAK